MITVRSRPISCKLCVRLFMLCKIWTGILRILWRHLQTDLRNVWCVTKTSGPVTKCRKLRPNRCIIGDAIHPEAGTKLTKNAVLNLAPSDATEINRIIGAQLYHPSCIQLLKKILKNLLPVRLAPICSFRAVLDRDYLYEIWHLLSALCSDEWKKLVIVNKKYWILIFDLVLHDFLSIAEFLFSNQ